MAQLILAGDIGGTKTLLALFEAERGALSLVRDQLFESESYNSLEAVLAEFLGGKGGAKVQTACFGIAGAVVDGEVHATNLTWDVSEAKISVALGGARVRLLNDLAATAAGMPYLAPAELAVLNPGKDPHRRGNIAVIAAGTGLGEAMLYWDGARHHPVASEGGHADFAPRNEREIDLLRYLQEHFGPHASYERVLSGPGFFNIYCFLRDRGYAPEPEWLRERLRTGDHSAIVAEAGLAGKSELCQQTLEMFSSMYGAEAGNLALRTMALGGVFVGGGIAPKLIDSLRQGAFMRSFVSKGRFEELLSGLEVSVSLNPRTALIGAAHYALTL